MCEFEMIFHKVTQGRGSDVEVDAVSFLNQRDILVLAGIQVRALITGCLLVLQDSDRYAYLRILTSISVLEAVIAYIIFVFSAIDATGTLPPYCHWIV